MHLDNLLCDAQAKTEMLFVLMGFVTAIESVEYGFLFLIRDTGTIVGYPEQQFVRGSFQKKGDLAACGSIAYGVVQ